MGRSLTTCLALGLALCAGGLALCAGTAGAEEFPRRGFAGAFLVAGAAEARGDWETTRTALAASVAADSGNADILHWQCVSLLNAARFDEAVVAARALLSLEPKSHLARLVLVTSSLKNGDGDEAREQIARLDDEGLGQYLKPFLLAWIKADEGDSRGASAALEPLAGLPSVGPLYHLHAGLVAARANNPQQTRIHFASVLANSPSWRSLALIAGYYQRTNKPARADAVRTAAKAAGLDAILIRSLDTPSPDRNLVTLQDSAAEVLFGLAVLLQDEGAADVALPYLRLAQALRPDFPLAKLLAGDLLVRAGQYDEAAGTYTALHDNAEVGALASLRLASLDLARGERENARLLLGDILATEPDWSQAWNVLGDVELAGSRHDMAATAYKQALDHAPEEDEEWRAHLIMAQAQALLKSGNQPEAGEMMEQALALAPDSAMLLNEIGYLWAERGVRLDKAEEHIKKAKHLEPDNGAILDSLGWVKYRQGNHAEAVRLLELATEALPYDPVVNDHLGDAYWAAGRQAEARFQWERSIRWRDTASSGLISVEELENKLARGIGLTQTAQSQ